MSHYSVIVSVALLLVVLSNACHRKSLKKEVQTIVTEEKFGIHFNNLTFKEALSSAKKNNKLLFIDFYTTWCMPCKMMDSGAFADKMVGDLHNAHFINLKVDGEKAEGRDLIKKYSVMGYPTLLYLNQEGEVLHIEAGSHSINGFLSISQNVVNTQSDKTQ